MSQDATITDDMLRKAMDHGEIMLYYQPIIDAHQNHVIGFEALSRWNRDGEPIPPSVFIPLASIYGLAETLDIYVLKKSIEQSLAWQKNGFDKFISVNISMDSMNVPFACAIVDAVLSFDRSSSIVIEITESEQAISREDSMQAVKIIADAGIKVVLDDFGSGFSNLSYVVHYPIHGIKIDRMFIDALGRGMRGPVAAMVILAIEHGLSVVAEGVETELEKQALLDLDCFIHQGYHYGRPVPPSAVHFEL
jgi:EAL domain-containing protein (putative c-di-GMP-specific phosphodiesterase class I)